MMLKKRIREILTENVVSVSPRALVREAADLMREHDVSCVPVLEDGRPTGILTERDIVRAAAWRDPDFIDLPVTALMSTPVVTVSPDTLGHEAYNRLKTNHVRHLPVVDGSGRCVGVVSQTDVVSNMGYEYFVQLRKVSGEMIRTVSSLPRTETVGRALAIMAERGISCVLVVENERPAGILTERDAAVLATRGADVKSMPLEEAMSSPVVSVRPDIPVHEALSVMRRHAIRRLVITDEAGRLAGVVTQTDVVNSMEWQYVEILREIIRDKEERYLNIFENSTEGIFQSSLSRRFLTVNPAMARLFGYDSPEAMLEEIADVGAQLFVDPEQANEALQSLLTKNDPLQFDGQCRRRDGSLLWAAFSMRSVRDAAGAPLFFDGICMDITERKQAEARLVEREARYRSIVEDQSELICRYRPDGRLSFVNEAYARYFGKDRSELINANFVPHIPPKDMEMVQDLIGGLRPESPAVQFEHRIIRPDGEIRWQSWTHRAFFSRDGELLEFQAVGQDVTERKRVEEALQNQCNFVHTLLEALPAPVFFKDKAGSYLGCNRAFEEFLGKPRAQILGRTVYDLAPRELAEVYWRKDKEALDEGGTQTYESRVMTASGELREVIFNKAAYRNAAGEVVGLIGAIQDVTEAKRTQEELRTQYNFMHALLDALSCPVFFKDKAGVYQGCNRAFEELTGLAREDLVGRTVRELLPEAAALTHEEMDRQILETGVGLSYEAQLYRRREIVGNSLHTKDVYLDASGRPAGLIGVIVDITERMRNEEALRQARDQLEVRVAERTAELNERNRQLNEEIERRNAVEEDLRESRRFLETVINSINDGISVLDADLTILSVNDAMRAWYDWNAPLEGRKCHEVYHDCVRPCERCPSLLALAEGRPQSEVVPKIASGKQAGWLELFAYPFRDGSGEIKGVVEFVRDITERKKLEGELVDALERAETANNAKSVFLANMSHEIRTPLNAVLGYIQLALLGELEPRQRERLTVAEESAQTLLCIINDVLDYSKIEAGKLEIKAEEFNLHELLETLVKEQNILASGKGLELRLRIDESAPGWLRGDSLRLRQILRNLVNNAVKYTERGRIEVEAVGRLETSPDNKRPPRARLLFTVTDTGVGISAEDQQRVFDSFTQADSGLSKRHAGAGLGLAICKRLSELMGGSMWFESEEGRGSAFYFAVSLEAVLDRRESPRTPTGFETDADLGRLRVLLVEDNMINQMFAVDLLQSRGHLTTVAENGLCALEELEKGEFDVILMDIQMPVMNGLEATRAIRAHDGSRFDPNVPIIGLSAFAMDQERERFMEAGLDGYITKPVNVEAFFKAVTEVLGRREAQVATDGGAPSPRPARGGEALDTAALFIQYRNKRELLAKVGGEFFARAPEYLDAMEEALRRDDRETFARMAHTLKGNAAMFGAGLLRERAARAEAQAADVSAGELDNLLKFLKADLESAVAALKEFLNRLGV